MIQCNITLTWSKVMALVVTVLSFCLDIVNGTATTLMTGMPFVTALILGKQYVDAKKESK